MKIKLIITGYKDHGKDSVCEILEPALSSCNSSIYACENFLFAQLKDKYGYRSTIQCHDDRVNHRKEWYDAIREWNGDTPSRLGEAIFSEYDIYNGMRHIDEYIANREQKTFHYLIWVDSSVRMGMSEDNSMSLNPVLADFIIDNNGPEEDLPYRVKEVMDQVMLRFINEYDVFADGDIHAPRKEHIGMHELAYVGDKDAT